MAKTKSAQKSVRKETKRKAKNLEYKNKIKGLTKKAKNLLEEGKKEEAQKLLPTIYKAIDKAAKVNVIKKNTAARKKSRITKAITREPTQINR